ncbi:hypothetical protein [Methanococcus maripaludis]|uniref:Uncharacterized membrane protein YbjE (DUF340 family) n=2 Tax=Methanococcus maripaludis TaxID=39152 RepID=A0A7J9PFI8_METMI|nr:hypothetical protein [Methanococcus maripaludis]MBA2862015.1 uncharacterized membrane protein YbjE (DUF340 family) [Methanococcus maripaludis]
MNIIYILIVGLIIGYLFKSKFEKIDLSKPINLALLLLIFFMGVESGKVDLNAFSTFVVSMEFSIIVMVTSLLTAVFLGGRFR